jgi:hypothetical protein
MIDAEFVKEIVNLTRQSEALVPVELDGRLYVYHGNQVSIEECREPRIDAVIVHNLSGLCEFATRNKFDFPVFMHVGGPTKVRLLSGIVGHFNQRHECAVAELPGEGGFRFHQWHEREAFQVALMAQFTPSGDRDKIIQLIGQLTDGTVRTYEDDGVTQKATARVGVQRKAEIDVPNPVRLAPYRTFREVEQPESEFIFRLRSREEGPPEAALFEADGGAWYLMAIENIKAWLVKNLERTEIPVIA